MAVLSARKTPASAPVAFAPIVAAATVFLASGAVLMLEILAVRLLAPYVGLTMETTTSIIGAVLAGIALGAAVGGWFADRTDPRRLIVTLLIVGGLLSLLTVPVVRWLGPGARGHGNLAALGVTLASLVPSAAVLSAISPTVARLQLRDLGASGTIVGRLSAFATAGALVGTFGTGFVVVPLLPVSTAVLGIGLVLAAGGLVLGGYARAIGRQATVAAIVAVIGLGLLSATRSSPCDAETSYHCAVITTDLANANGRILVLDGAHNSYVDVADPTDLVPPYIRWIAKATNTAAGPGRPLNALFVGGGGFTLPQWLVATHPGSHAQVLEVDKKLVDLDRRSLGLKLSPELRATVGDARTTLRGVPRASVDLVVGDAFSGMTIPWHLLTREWLEQVHSVLKPGGLYALNLIDFEKLKLTQAEAATLFEVFRDVQIVAVPSASGSAEGGNQVLLASDRPRTFTFDPAIDGAIDYPDASVRAFAARGTHLRDDFAPVDQLQVAPPT